MSRIFPAIMTMVGGVLLYLCLRVFKQHKITTRVQNAVMFVPTAIIFGFWAYFSKESVWVGWEIILLMIPVCFFFGWLANLLSLRSIQNAPNIGYSLVISKSYVILTAIAAVPLLGSTLMFNDILAIIMVVGFMGLILVDPQKNKSNSQGSNLAWVRNALYAFFGRSGLALSSTWFIGQGISPLVLNFWIFLIISVIILLESFLSKKTMLPPKNSFMPALGVVASMVLFNRAIQEGYFLSPNPGYINAANSSSVAILALVSSWIFKDELSTRKMIGIIGVVLGISILFIY